MSQLSEDDKKILKFDILAMVVDTLSTNIHRRRNAFAHEATLEEMANAVGDPLLCQESKTLDTLYKWMYDL